MLQVKGVAVVDAAGIHTADPAGLLLQMVEDKPHCLQGAHPRQTAVLQQERVAVDAAADPAGLPALLRHIPPHAHTVVAATLLFDEVFPLKFFLHCFIGNSIGNGDVWFALFQRAAHGFEMGEKRPQI